MSKIKFIKLKEHDSFPAYENLDEANEPFPAYKELDETEKKQIKKSKSKLFEKNQYLGDLQEKQNPNLNAYHIGLDWLIEDELALMVEPKIEHLDFLKMFMNCFKHKDKDVSKKINKIYDIEIKKKSIPLKPPNFEITPFLIIHFIKVLKNLVQRGLKKNYIRIEENLSSKIKGKIFFSQHLKKNIVLGRNDRVFCNYQEDSIDCLENQFLKKALLFCQNYLNQYLKETQEENLNIKELNKTILFCKSFFANVSDIKETKILKQFKINKLYRDYTEALQLAQMILRRFSYNLQQTQQTRQKQNKIPPFWIDMALLFEVYVLSKLKDTYGSEKIKYQPHGKYGETDFLKVSDEEKIIIDAKYKEKYKNSYEIGDIRQLAGYARDTGVLKKLKIEDKEMDNTVVPCLIIYPNPDGIENFKSENLLANPIEGFTEFYKMGIRLPTKNI